MALSSAYQAFEAVTSDFAVLMFPDIGFITIDAHVWLFGFVQAGTTPMALNAFKAYSSVVIRLFITVSSVTHRAHIIACFFEAIPAKAFHNGLLITGTHSVAAGTFKTGPAVVRVTHNKNSFPDK